METLGSLIDKLIVVKLKQDHTPAEQIIRIGNLGVQEMELLYEISDYFSDAVHGIIPIGKISVKPCKVHTGTPMPDVDFTNMGILIAILAQANCEIWHCQEKLYNFKGLSPEEKELVVEMITKENLKRSRCIEGIDMKLLELVK